MKYFVKIILLCAIFSSCQKNDDDQAYIPGLYLHCKVDGMDWYPDKQSGIGDYPLTASIVGDTMLSIIALHSIQTIALSIKDSDGIIKNTYRLDSDKNYSNFGLYDMDLSNTNYITDNSNTGKVEISLLDKKGKLIVGNFSFQAYNKSLNKIVSITDGEFSLYYTTN